jgi:predicted ATP-dependent endonuclease of OLD family
MKITSISIKNFRSIRDELTFPIQNIGGGTCYVLLGINESGKSTILDGIALLDGQEEIDYELDCNKEAQDEDESIEITYHLDIGDETKYKDKLIQDGLNQDLVTKIKFTEVHRRIIFEKDEERSDDYNIWIKDDKQFEKFVFVKNEEGKRIIELRTAENEKQAADGTGILNLLTKEAFETYLETKLFDSFEEELPEIIFWKALEDKYLISKPIDLNTFKEDPNTSIPLRNCFRIAGISTPEKIKSRIDAIIGKASKSAELQQKLSESVTAHINTIWKEHDVSVKFSIDNLQLSFLVEDNDNDLPKYGVPQRSDGFKHFISILLNLSAENKTQSLNNKIVLLDEPEIHLHPSGQRYLRDELLEISKNNLVVFATHSVYMVDTKNIDRHFSVKKHEGRTIALKIEKDNPYREEVLYEALGTSVLELIEPNVLIFEGKTDRDIFELYTRKLKTDLKPPKVSLISADGCKNILKYTKFFNTKVVKGYVVVDSDEDGVQQKDTVLKEQGYDKNNTFEINDIYDTKKESTLEDLFDKKFLIRAIKERYDLDIDLDTKKPLIAQLKEKLKEIHKPYKDEDKEVIRQSYFDQISKLTKDELKGQDYFGFSKTLCEKVKSK